MVLCNARQGIHINRTEDWQKRLIARQGIHLLPVNPLTGNKRLAVPVFLLIWFP
jgi:hypothetical protein